MAAQNSRAEAKKFGKSSEQERKQMEARIAQIDNTIRCLYEDRVVGRITPERYDLLAAGYETEQTELRKQENSPLLHLYHNVRIKFLIAIAELCRAAVLLGDGGNGDKSRAAPTVLGGMIPILSLAHISVKAVGGNHIKGTSVAQFRGKVEVPFILGECGAG